MTARKDGKYGKITQLVEWLIEDQQVIAEFNGKPGMLNNWRRQGVPAYAKAKLVFIADERLVDVCEARSRLK